MTIQGLVWSKIKKEMFKNQKVFSVYLGKVQNNQNNHKKFKLRNKTKYF